MKKLREYNKAELEEMGIMYDPWTKTEVMLLLVIAVQIVTLVMTAIHIINYFN